MNLSDEAPFDQAEQFTANHPDDIVALYSMDERCRYASPSHLTILGYSTEQMMGKPWTDCVAPEDHAHASLGGDDALLHGESIEFGLHGLTVTGERVPLRGTARILFDVTSNTGYLLFHAHVVEPT